MLSVLVASCSIDDVKPQGTLDEETAFANADKLVTAAYAKLGNDWYSYPFNLWPYGDMSADDWVVVDGGIESYETYEEDLYGYGGTLTIKVTVQDIR